MRVGCPAVHRPSSAGSSSGVVSSPARANRRAADQVAIAGRYCLLQRVESISSKADLESVDGAMRCPYCAHEGHCASRLGRGDSRPCMLTRPAVVDLGPCYALTSIRFISLSDVAGIASRNRGDTKNRSASRKRRTCWSDRSIVGGRLLTLWRKQPKAWPGTACVSRPWWKW